MFSQQHFPIVVEWKHLWRPVFIAKYLFVLVQTVFAMWCFMVRCYLQRHRQRLFVAYNGWTRSKNKTLFKRELPGAACWFIVTWGIAGNIFSLSATPALVQTNCLFKRELPGVEFRPVDLCHVSKSSSNECVSIQTSTNHHLPRHII